jgi:glycosyltransferase involved in cell wall biosynthesis
VKRLNVVHIIGALPVGGVERNLVRVLPMLDREAFNVSVITIRERGELAPALEAAGVPVELSYMKTRYSPVSLWRLARRLREKEADIVHCHMRRANTSGRLAAMLARVPVRLAHERDLGLGKRPRHYRVDRLLGRWNGPVLCVTRGVAEHNRERSGLPASSFLVQYNGLDLAPFLAHQDRTVARERFGLPPDRPVVGYIGRLHRIKDLPLLLRGFARARVELPDPVLALVGEGKEEPALRALAVDLGIAERVRFLPWQHDLPLLYAALDVFAFTSRSEGIANVQLEAAAAGVPLVSTRVGIAAEAFRPGVDYLPVEWTEESVARGIEAALQPGRAAELIAAARERVQDFSLERQRDEMEALYQRLWREAAGTGAAAEEPA